MWPSPGVQNAVTKGSAECYNWHALWHLDRKTMEDAILLAMTLECKLKYFIGKKAALLSSFCLPHSYFLWSFTCSPQKGRKFLWKASPLFRPYAFICMLRTEHRSCTSRQERFTTRLGHTSYCTRHSWPLKTWCTGECSTAELGVCEKRHDACCSICSLRNETVSSVVYLFRLL